MLQSKPLLQCNMSYMRMVKTGVKGKFVAAHKYGLMRKRIT
jgi:hypothetical protein